tara:strand:+ start:26279 stop:27424 length:1146 start_codon:yes stop_codon:yes gene_type:complete
MEFFMDYATLKVVWWVLVGVVLCLYGLTCGFDLGVGTLLPFVAKKNDERRVLINSIGPTWDGNQVWLIFAGGALFVVWPMVYGVVFSGLYFALILLLFSMFLRPVGFEYRHKIHSATWQKSWDWAIFVGSAVPALLIGVTLGNLMLGLPFHMNDEFRSFYTGSFWQLLSPFAIIVGLVSVSMLATHGATFLQMRTEDVIHERSRKTSILFAAIYLVLFLVAGGWIANGLPGYHLSHLPQMPLAQFSQTTVDKVPSGLLANYGIHPLFLIAPLVAILGSILVIVMAAMRKSKMSFLGSAMMVVGSMFTFGLSMFPFVVPSSTVPDQSLTIWSASSAQYTLQIMFVATCIILPFVAFYTQWVYRKMWGPVTVEHIERNGDHLY